jgi:hypothetical protein
MKVLRGSKGQSQIRNPCSPLGPAKPKLRHLRISLSRQPQHKGVSIFKFPAYAHTMLMRRYQESLHRKTLARRPQCTDIQVSEHSVKLHLRAKNSYK